MADDLREVLEQAKRDCPEIPAHAWQRLERSIRMHFGASKLYVASQRKQTRLEMLAAMDAATTAEEIAKKLGVSVQYARYLRRVSR